MKKTKIISMVLCSIMLCAGCTSGKTESETTDSETTEKETAVEGTSDADFIVRSIIVNTDTQSMQVKADYSGDDEEQLNVYSIAGLENINFSTSEGENATEITWSGFYSDTSAYEIVQVTEGFAGTKEAAETVQSVETAAEPEFVEAKNFVVTAGQGTITVCITPFSAVIQPSNGWREEGEVYVVLAFDEEGNASYVSQLPAMDDRKSKEQEAYPLSEAVLQGQENLDVDSLNLLIGEGNTGMVLDNDGVRYAWANLIDMDSIDHVEVLPYIWDK